MLWPFPSEILLQQTAAQPEATKYNSFLSLMKFKPTINQAGTLINLLYCVLAREESISAPLCWSGSVVILKYQKHILCKSNEVVIQLFQER